MIRCLSVRQPYAWAIIHAGKDIENRSRRCRVRGRILIHASRSVGTLAQFQASFDRVCQALGGGFTYPSREHRGGIIGSVEIVDSDVWSDSPWFEGPWGWFLRDPKPIEFIPCTGRLGFFPAPEYVVRILAQRGEL